MTPEQIEQRLFNLTNIASSTWIHCESKRLDPNRPWRRLYTNEQLEEAQKTLRHLNEEFTHLENDLLTDQKLLASVHLRDLKNSILNFNDSVNRFVYAEMNDLDYSSNVLKNCNQVVNTVNELVKKIESFQDS